MKILRLEHLKAYLTAADKRDALPMFYLELVSRVRKGELVALRWDDLDMKHRTISVSKQLVRNSNGEVILSRPKTEASVRQVSIPQDAVNLLIQGHSRHADTPYIFPSPTTGEMYHQDSVVNIHKKILKDVGLPHVRFHDLRHTCATLMISGGVPLVVISHQLGHAQASTTANIYAHAIASAQAKAAQTFDRFNDLIDVEETAHQKTAEG